MLAIYMSNIFLLMVYFAIVGGIGLIIDFGLTWILRDKFGFNQYFANGCGFVFAVVNNYILNKYYTFHDLGAITLKQFVIFFIISTIGLSLNTLFLFILHKWLKIKFYWAKLFAIGLVFLWNFILNSFITFN